MEKDAKAGGTEGFRLEHDLIGEREIPAGDLRGIHTLRAAENFFVAGRPVSPRLVRAYALVKKACARANRETGFLDPARADAIERACDEIARGERAELFALDALQGGAGTSTNMNLNEVIANRANELLGLSPGSYSNEGVHPLDHVNLHQSTNDTYPTALKVALIEAIREAAEAAATLQGAFQKKEKESALIVTTGRTELQAAVPMTLGAVFSAMAEAAGRDRWRTFKCEERIRTVNLGGTAVGTGLAAPRAYVFRATDVLREITGYPLARAENLVDQTANADAFVEIAGILSSFSSNLVKAARDVRLLAHEGDITLTPLQAGSSIMPGKVNPVACEAVIQGGMRARAVLSIVADAASHGTLQINEYLPLVADALFEALALVTASARTLAACINGVTPDAARCAEALENNPVIVTAFLPYVGYERAQALLGDYRARSLERANLTIRAYLEERLGKDLVDRVLSADALSALGFPETVRLIGRAGATPESAQRNPQ